MRHDAGWLNRYLVADVEDPRINLQSIIGRAFLIDALWPDEFTTLIREEFRFSICLNFILRTLATEPQASRLSLLDALADGCETCGDVRLPVYLRQAFAAMSRDESALPDYLSQALTGRLSDDDDRLPDNAMSTFEHLWSSVLSRKEAGPISVLEPACGSANDYRYLHSFGLSQFLEYTGFDICEKNIANARRRFPSARFDAGDVMNIDAEDKSYDFLFIHDLFEHLSPAALERALAEVCRVTRKQACLSFFSMADIAEHVVRPVKPYHWNTLSVAKTCNTLMKSARDVDVVHIGTFLRDNYGCTDHHNRGAYAFVVSLDSA
jgi:SAM-dependent methyltransferase